MALFNEVIHNFPDFHYRKDIKILKIEKTALKIDNTYLKNKILGDIDCKTKLPEITSDCTFLYRNNRYFIIVDLFLRQACGRAFNLEKSHKIGVKRYNEI